MTKRMLGALVLLSAVAGAAPQGRVDAFLSKQDTRPLVDARGLSPMARDAWQAGFVSSIEPRYGVPTFFWSSPATPGARSFRDMGLNPQEAARRYLATHAELYRASPGRWAKARVTQVHDLHDGGAVIVTFQQRVNDVRVFRDELKVIMNAKLQLVALSGYLTPETKVRGDFTLAPTAAIGAAFEALTGRALDGAALTALGQFGEGYEHWRLVGSQTPVRTRAVFFPLPSGLVPAFYVELDAPRDTGASVYEALVVSAVDGAVLYRKNLTADAFTYKVWADPTTKLPMDGPQGLGATPHPTGSPNGFDPGHVAQSQVTLDNAGLSTNDPWLAPGATRTQGNNVMAYADLQRSNGFTMGMDPIGTPSAADAFDYTYDFNVDPEANATQRQAAITQLFYNTNFFHDWYYDDGFDEAAGNAQTSNLGRGGSGNDALLAEAQDYSGRSNANMSTPSDGASPRMQMYIFDAQGTSTLTANTAPTAQTFPSLGSSLGAPNYTTTGALAVADDGDATPPSGAMAGSRTDACTAANWPVNVTGKIVLVDRGNCAFTVKARAAQTNGAIGIIIANNTGTTPTDIQVTDAMVTLPVMGVSLASGNNLKMLISSGGGTLTATMARQAMPNRDGTLDNGVVAHEWGHFISNRLIGDGNGISNLQAVGMGEGWADFHAALMIARAEDAQVASNANWEGAFGLAGWAGAAMDAEAYYFGFRRYPLSWSFSRNPLTFKHIGDGTRLPTTAPLAFGASGASNSEVHNTGEVWAVMLWDCYVNLLRDSRYTFEQARAKMKRYLVAAYKATALMPTFVDARDAVLAVTAADDATNFANFWAAFARRGLGMGAVAPNRDSQDNTPLTESFTVGNAINVTSVTLDDSAMSCDHDGTLDANERGVLTVKLRNSGTGTLVGSAVTLTSATTGVTFPSGATQALPSTAPFATATLTFPVALGDVAMPQAGMFTITVTDASLAMGPVTEQAMFRLNFDVRAASSTVDDVEAPMSQWQAMSNQNLTTGSDFRIFQSSATEHFWFGPNPASPADTYLISPPLEVGQAPLVVTFKHRFDFEDDGTESYDGAVIEVSDGTTWTDVGAQSTPGYTGTLTTSMNQSSNPLRGRMAFVAKSPGYPAFNLETVNLGTTYAGKTVRFRFRIGADDAAAAKGWEIDDIHFTGITNHPFSSVVSDPNSCTNQAPTATIGPDLELDEGAQVTLVGGGTDPDNDPLTLTWTQTSGPMATIVGSSFTAPMVTADTQITLELVVSDGRAVTPALHQNVLVKNVNHPPIATVPATMEVNQGEAVTVLGSGSDPDGDAITFEWTQLEGPQVGLTGNTTDTVTFTAPSVLVREVVRLQLVVRDGVNTSAPAVVDVVVKNPAPVMHLTPKDPVGCGCTSGVELLPFGLLLVLRSRRRRS